MRLAQVRKVVCFFASVLPLVYMVYLVYRYSSGDPAALGADPGKEIVLFLGGWALVLLLVTLSVSPLQDLLKSRHVQWKGR